MLDLATSSTSSSDTTGNTTGKGKLGLEDLDTSSDTVSFMLETNGRTFKIDDIIHVIPPYVNSPILLFSANKNILLFWWSL